MSFVAFSLAVIFVIWLCSTSAFRIPNIDFVFNWMISNCMLFGIFIIFCSLSKNGLLNAKIQFSSLAKWPKSCKISNDPCNNLIFSVNFLNCHYQQHLESAPLYGNWLISSVSNSEMNSFNLPQQNEQVFLIWVSGCFRSRDVYCCRQTKSAGTRLPQPTSAGTQLPQHTSAGNASRHRIITETTLRVFHFSQRFSPECSTRTCSMINAFQF